MAKEKKEQVVADNVMSLLDDGTDNLQDYSNPEYWKSLNQENVPPQSKENLVSSQKQQEKIETLYPVFSRKRIPLGKLVPADENWNFFPEQGQGMLRELMENIVAYGQLSPAIVWKQTDGTYMILGGHTRFEAIRRLHDIFHEAGDVEQEKRFQTMDCNVYDHAELDEIEARKIIICDNVIRRDNTTAIKARAVINMARLENETRSKRRPGTKRERALSNVADALGESVGTVKRLYSLRQLIQEFWPMVNAKDQANRITTQYAMAIALLPIDIQHYILQQEYYKKTLSASKMAVLKKALTKEDVDAVYSAPESYSVSSHAEIDEAVPQDYVSFPIVFHPDEMKAVTEVVEWSVCERGDISESTKNLLRKIISSVKMNLGSN